MHLTSPNPTMCFTESEIWAHSDHRWSQIRVWGSITQDAVCSATQKTNSNIQTDAWKRLQFHTQQQAIRWGLVGSSWTRCSAPEHKMAAKHRKSRQRLWSVRHSSQTRRDIPIYSTWPSNMHMLSFTCSALWHKSFQICTKSQEHTALHVCRLRFLHFPPPGITIATLKYRRINEGRV